MLLKNKFSKTIALSFLIFAMFGTLPAFAQTCIVYTAGDPPAGTSIEGTLRSAIEDGCNSIAFALPYYPATITLTYGELQISSNLTITGPGAEKLAISGNNASRIFHISGASTEVNISGLTIRDGRRANTDVGGGIFLEQGTLNLTDSAVSENFAGRGGGIYVYGGTLNLTRSIISGNGTSPYPGGGIYVRGGTLNLTNSTVANNQVWAGYVPGTSIPVPGFGGGISTGQITDPAFQAATVTLTNSTIFGNRASGSAGIQMTGSTATFLKNTLLALNIAEETSWPGNCTFGSIPVSLGHNLSDDNSCSLSGNGDSNNIPAGLATALADNGGPTLTVALLPGSSAVDAIPTADCTDLNGSPIYTDQRGVPRPLGAGCDIGAFEYFIPELIDVQPNSEANSINLGSGGTIPVAICSSPEFDPTSSINLQSIQFAGAFIAGKGKALTPMVSYEYLSVGACAADSTYPDLLLHFNTNALVLSPDTVAAFLTGMTATEPPRGILGWDAVQIVPRGK